MKRNIITLASALCLCAAVPGLSAVPVTLSPSASIALKKASAARERPVSAFVCIDPSIFNPDSLEAIGATLIVQSGDMATVRVPVGQLGALAGISGVRYVQSAASATQQLDKALADVGATDVKAGTGLTSGYTGAGVIVGIVDAGFDYNHAAFRDKEGNLRIKRVWEQTATPGGEFRSPDKYGYGVELSTPDEITRAEGDIRNNTHGTHVAGIAAGSDLYLDGALQGAAPDADIVLVSMDSNSGDNVAIAEGVAYIFDYAEAEGKPCVVNLSLGTHAGPHDGTSSFDRLIDSLQGPGRLIVGSAGNDRAAKFHVTHTFESAADAPLYTCIDYLKSVNAVNVGGNIELWATAGQDIEVALAAIDVRTGQAAERVVIYPAAESVSTVSLGRNITGSFTVASESANPLNGKPHVLLTSAVTAIRTNYAIAIEVTPKTAGQVDIWADNVYLGLAGKGVEGYTDANGSTIAELGGTSSRILTVGAYTTRKTYTVYGETYQQSLDETVGDISSFSNYGPTADGRLKPQVAAPGCYIVSAVSVNAVTSVPLSHSYEADGRWMSYGYMQGTSMSSPLVAGVVATWLQACPELTPEQLAEVVKNTSRSDAFTGDLSQGSNDWGWGKLDAMAGLKECVRLADLGSVSSITANQSNLMSFDGETLHIMFSQDSPRATVSVVNTLGSTAITTHLGAVTAGSDYTLPLSTLTPGIYIVTISTPTAATTLKICR